MGQHSVVESRLDQIEAEMVQRKAEHAAILRRLGRGWRMWLVCVAMALAAIAGSYKASLVAVHETRAREAEACQQRVEGRDGIRTLILAVLPLTPSTGPAHKTLSDLLSTSLAPLPPCT